MIIKKSIKFEIDINLNIILNEGVFYRVRMRQRPEPPGKKMQGTYLE